MTRKQLVSSLLPVPVVAGMLLLLVLRALFQAGGLRCRSSRSLGSLVWALVLPRQVLLLVGFDLARGNYSELFVRYDQPWILLL